MPVATGDVVSFSLYTKKKKKKKKVPELSTWRNVLSLGLLHKDLDVEERSLSASKKLVRGPIQ